LESGSLSTIVVDDGTRLYYRVDGDRDWPAVLSLNSIGTDLRLWDPQVAYLSNQFQVVRYDFRGHGRSDCPPGPYSIERLALDALAILETLDLFNRRLLDHLTRH
jgi:3-oxoadipate enol-lactonase